MDNNLNYAEINYDEDQHWIWRNGMCGNVKKRIHVLEKKLNSLSRQIELTGSPNQYLKDVQDLNTELTGYFSALADNINIRDLFDFLTICFYEYEHFFKEHKNQIVNDEQNVRDLMPMATEVVYVQIRGILDFISNNTIDSLQYRAPV